MIRFENVSYSYPFQKEKVLKDISFTVKKGEVLLITGESGCGKSTLAKAMNGLIPHYLKGKLDGDIYIDNNKNSSSSIADIAGLIGTLFQDPEQQFFCNDVYGEISFAHEVKGKDCKEIRDITNSYANSFEVEHLLKSSIFSLSEGEKQKVALASILSLSPKCIILDEPSANLSIEATDKLGMEIKILKNRGFAIVIVDHRLYWLSDIADRVFIMKDGEISHSGKYSILECENLRKKYGLRSNYISESSKDINNFKHGLEVRNLSFGYKNKPTIFDNLSISFQAGKVTALSGHNGCGKTTLSRLITGLLKAKKGEFYFNGKKYPPKKLLKMTSLVLQNTDHQLYSRTVLGEVGGEVDILKNLRLIEFKDRHPQSLSGGQKQRLVIAAAIAKKADILILDEPTSGLDCRNMEIIGEILQKEAEQNRVVIIITHDKEFINNHCDEILKI